MTCTIQVHKAMTKYTEYKIIKMKASFRLKDRCIYWYSYQCIHQLAVLMLRENKKYRKCFLLPYRHLDSFQLSWCGWTVTCLHFLLSPDCNHVGWHSTQGPYMVSHSRIAWYCPRQQDVLAGRDALLHKLPLNLPVTLVPWLFIYLLKDLWEL